MFFWKRKKPEAPLVPEKTAIGDPFAVVPVKPEDVELKRDSHGMIHLRLTAKPDGLTGKLVDWLRYDYTRKLELDETGTLYYSCVDGHTTLDTITNRIAEKLEISRQDAERNVIQFTKNLMMRNLLSLMVPEELVARRSNEQ